MAQAYFCLLKTKALLLFTLWSSNNVILSFKNIFFKKEVVPTKFAHVREDIQGKKLHIYF